MQTNVPLQRLSGANSNKYTLNDTSSYTTMRFIV